MRVICKFCTDVDTVKTEITQTDFLQIKEFWKGISFLDFTTFSLEQIKKVDGGVLQMDSQSFSEVLIDSDIGSELTLERGMYETVFEKVERPWSSHLPITKIRRSYGSLSFVAYCDILSWVLWHITGKISSRQWLSLKYFSPTMVIKWGTDGLITVRMKILQINPARCWNSQQLFQPEKFLLKNVFSN